MRTERLNALNNSVEGRTLVRVLRLDRPERVKQRRMIIEILFDASKGSECAAIT